MDVVVDGLTFPETPRWLDATRVAGARWP